MKRTLVNVGQDTTLGDCDVTEQLVQLLIVADGELEMTRDDTGLLVVTSGVASKFEDFSRKVFQDGSEVDGSTSTDTLSVVALSQETVDTTDRECETRLGGSAAMEVSLCCGSRRRVARPNPTTWNDAQMANDLRLSVLGARGLAARFAASHFE